MCQMDSKWEAAVWHKELSLVLCDVLDGWDKEEPWNGREVQEGGDMCLLLMAFSCFLSH